MAFLKPYYNEAWYREYETQKFYLFANPPKDFFTCESTINELFSLIPKDSTFKDPDLGNKLDELYANDPLYKLIKQQHIMGRPTENHLKIIKQMRESLNEEKTRNFSTASIPKPLPVTPSVPDSNKKNKVTHDVVDHNTLVPEKKSFWKKLFGK